MLVIGIKSNSNKDYFRLTRGSSPTGNARNEETTSFLHRKQIVVCFLVSAFQIKIKEFEAIQRRSLWGFGKHSFPETNNPNVVRFLPKSISKQNT